MECPIARSHSHRRSLEGQVGTTGALLGGTPTLDDNERLNAFAMRIQGEGGLHDASAEQWCAHHLGHFARVRTILLGSGNSGLLVALKRWGSYPTFEFKRIWSVGAVLCRYPFCLGKLRDSEIELMPQHP